MNEEEITKKLGLKIPYFYRLENGDYEKLQTQITKGKVAPNGYVYDVETKKLIHINPDKTWNFIGGDAEQIFTQLTGTPDSPVRIGNLYDGAYIVNGNYTIKHVDTDFYAKAPVMVLVEVDSENPATVEAAVYSNSGCVVYKIEDDKTTIDKMVTEEVVAEVVSEVVEDQVQELVEEIVPEVVEDQVQPATDQEIDDMIDHLFPDPPQP